MTPKAIAYDDLTTYAGQEIGVSDWCDVTQEDVNTFAKCTRDEQWIHVDVERAKSESPFGTTIAHGFFTLALAPYLMGQVWEVTGAKFAVNYGCERLRFPAPVTIPGRIRARAVFQTVKELPGCKELKAGITIELEGGERPVLVIDSLMRYYA